MHKKESACGITELSVFLLSSAYPSKDLKPLRHTNKRGIAAALQQLPHRRLKALHLGHCFGKWGFKPPQTEK